MDPLETWDELNAVIREADEAQCLDLLKQELAGKRRKQFCHRIYSRLNRVRADRERSELQSVIDRISTRKTLHWLK